MGDHVRPSPGWAFGCPEPLSPDTTAQDAPQTENWSHLPGCLSHTLRPAGCAYVWFFTHRTSLCELDEGADCPIHLYTLTVLHTSLAHGGCYEVVVEELIINKTINQLLK